MTERWTTTEPNWPRLAATAATVSVLGDTLDQAFVNDLGGNGAAEFGVVDGLLQFTAERVLRLAGAFDPDLMREMAEAARAAMRRAYGQRR